MKRESLNIERIKKRQDVVNEWTSLLLENEIRRLRHQTTMTKDVIMSVEDAIADMQTTSDKYKDGLNTVEEMFKLIKRKFER